MTLVEFLLARIADDEHFGTHDHHLSKRWAAECDAKRRIAAEHPLIPAVTIWGDPRDGLACEVCDQEIDLTCGGYGYEVSNGCPTLRLLALPYADHPDYQEEWKP